MTEEKSDGTQLDPGHDCATAETHLAALAEQVRAATEICDGLLGIISAQSEHIAFLQAALLPKPAAAPPHPIASAIARALANNQMPQRMGYVPEYR